MKVIERKMVFTQNTFGLCDKKPKTELVKLNNAALGIPNICPVKKASTFCYKGNKLFKLSPVSRKMISLYSAVDMVTLAFSITHDTGTSCFEVDARVKKLN